MSTRSAKPPQCSYCKRSAAKWIEYRGYLARAGRAPYTPPIVTGACVEHQDCINFISLYRSLDSRGRTFTAHNIYADDIQRWRAAYPETPPDPPKSSMAPERFAALNAALYKAGLLGFDRLAQARNAIATYPDWKERWDVRDDAGAPAELRELGDEYRRQWEAL